MCIRDSRGRSAVRVRPSEIGPRRRDDALMSTGNGEPDCLIVGASARAAASSAVASGLRVITADLFDDRDTQSLAEHSFKVDDYPNGLLAIRSEYRTLPVVYTGALENYPRLLTEFEDAGPIWGNPASVVERVRDPFELCLLYTSPSPRDATLSRMPSSA